MTKSEFVDQVADRVGLGRSDAAEARRRGARHHRRRPCSAASEVTFSGFGKFRVAERGAREGVNPRTGEQIQIAASRSRASPPGSGLKKAVNG